MMSQKRFVSILIFFLVFSGIGNVLLAQKGKEPSITSSKKFLKLTPTRLEEQVKKKIEAQPNLSATEITAFANLILEKKGYDYSFDVCEFLTLTKSIAIGKRDEMYGTFLYRAPFFQIDEVKLTVQFSSGEAAPCGECFTEFPVHKLSATEIHTLVGGKCINSNVRNSLYLIRWI